jgi:hypothetical protein
LLKAIPIVLTAKILAIFAVAKGLAPWASVWCGGEWANAYPLKPLGGGSYIHTVLLGMSGLAAALRRRIPVSYSSSQTAAGRGCSSRSYKYPDLTGRKVQ